MGFRLAGPGVFAGLLLTLTPSVLLIWSMRLGAEAARPVTAVHPPGCVVSVLETSN